MMKKSILATLITLSAGFASTAMAALPPTTVNGSTVNFAGNLIPAACEVHTDSKNMAIDMGVVDLGSLPVTGAPRGAFIPFSIKLTNCDSAVSTQVNVSMLGQTISNKQTLANVATESPSNVRLSIKSITGNTWMSFDGTYASTTPSTITNGDMSLNYEAQYQAESISAKSTAGNTLFPVTYKVKYF